MFSAVKEVLSEAAGGALNLMGLGDASAQKEPENKDPTPSPQVEDALIKQAADARGVGFTPDLGLGQEMKPEEKPDLVPEAAKDLPQPPVVDEPIAVAPNEDEFSLSKWSAKKTG